MPTTRKQSQPKNCLRSSRAREARWHLLVEARDCVAARRRLSDAIPRVVRAVRREPLTVRPRRRHTRSGLRSRIAARTLGRARSDERRRAPTKLVPLALSVLRDGGANCCELSAPRLLPSSPSNFLDAKLSSSKEPATLATKTAHRIAWRSLCARSLVRRSFRRACSRIVVKKRFQSVEILGCRTTTCSTRARPRSGRACTSGP